MPRIILGLDVGGANLKAAWVAPQQTLCHSQPFALWRDPAGLTAALAGLIARHPPADALAVTMTGELCDCFATKGEGIRHILDAVALVASDRPVHVWTTEGEFLDLDAARNAPPLTVASANWLALAIWAGRFIAEGPGLLLDVGSTTTDIIPLKNGRPMPRARDDSRRLLTGELVYRGARRTPVCALTEPHDDVAAEFFATILDVFLVLGDIPPAPEDCDTADGRAATRINALARLNRMFCLDADDIDVEVLEPFAHTLRERLLEHLVQKLEEQLAYLRNPVEGVVLSGSGEFLGRLVLQRVADLDEVRVWSLAEQLGPDVSSAACAHAVAVLLDESS